MCDYRDPPARFSGRRYRTPTYFNVCSLTDAHNTLPTLSNILVSQSCSSGVLQLSHGALIRQWLSGKELVFDTLASGKHNVVRAYTPRRNPRTLRTNCALLRFWQHSCEQTFYKVTSSLTHTAMIPPPSTPLFEACYQGLQTPVPTVTTWAAPTQQ